MVSCVVWVVVDFCISIARVFSLQLLDSNSYMSFLTDVTEENIHIQ
jgi:hypothetical protein